MALRKPQPGPTTKRPSYVRAARDPWIIIALAALFAPQFCMSVHGADNGGMLGIIRNSERVQASIVVREQYIQPLGLEGKDFRNALSTMLNQGFRCAIKDGIKGFLRPADDVPPFLECRKEATAVNEDCELLILGILARDGQVATRAQLVSDFDQVEVGNFVVFCSASIEATADRRAAFERNRMAAEDNLRERVRAPDTTGETAALVLWGLLERGDSCGIEPFGLSGKQVSPDRVVCIARSADAQHCIRERTVLELTKSTTGSERAIDALSKVIVRSQRSSCELPDALGD